MPWGLSDLTKKRPFIRLFTFYFTVINIVTTALFIFFGLQIIDRFFSYYVDKLHQETQNMLVMQAAGHYKMFNSWANYDGRDIGAVAKISGDFWFIR